MPTLTIKNIPAELHERLKKQAYLHRRSLNSEVIVCLERTLHSRPVDVERFLAALDALHKEVTLTPLTDKVLFRAKEAGRP